MMGGGVIPVRIIFKVCLKGEKIKTRVQDHGIIYYLSKSMVQSSQAG